ncbi:hypothetical protein BJP25_22345 [Actinokineospora bangkokensis]|uniref:Uncharacterized protein n=1 Tax=Actinokineospora bangkokensis TaxID=1193682 RepID=A0A1Q9LJW0_9PSEU|nr:hypothetical protein BJP25_22345 [Actinokineospora bangkokensis]
MELPEPAARDAADEPDDEDERAPRRDFSTRLSVILLVVAVLLAGGGLALWLRANAIDDRAGTNTALVDVSETVDLTGTVKDGLERIFSFNYQNTDATAQAAKEVLTGDAATQYDALIGQVREQAPAQQLVLTSKAVAAGVSVLEGDRATLLVFLNQTSTRAGGQPTYGGAQLTVTAQRVDGVWRIASLQPR